MDNDKFPKIEIEWYDINASDGGWLSQDDMDQHDVAYCKDIAYLYKQTPDKLYTFSSVNYHSDNSYEFGFVTCFPVGCIRKITRL